MLFCPIYSTFSTLSADITTINHVSMKWGIEGGDRLGQQNQTMPPGKGQ